MARFGTIKKKWYGLSGAVLRRTGQTGIFLLTLFSWSADGHVAVAQDIGNSHLELKNPSTQTPAELEAIYESLRGRLMEGYALSRTAGAGTYQKWTRYNTAPYLSATHGRRFVNNYANDKGASYGTLKQGETYPAGTIFAKDSITVTDDGKTFPGALFLMEKLAAGTSPTTADWRYAVVNPDGSMFGDTIGDEPDLVEYCHACHTVKASDDYVFFVPKAVRRTP